MYTVSRPVRSLSALLISAAMLTALGCSPKEPKPAPTPQTAASPIRDEAKSAASQIAADYLRDQITKISADEFEGRAPATPGDVKARQYIADQLQQIGFAPGGADGSYQQSF